jgi:hypothetical protein
MATSQKWHEPIHSCNFGHTLEHLPAVKKAIHNHKSVLDLDKSGLKG